MRSKVKVYIKIANGHFSRGRYEEAMECYREALTRSKGNAFDAYEGIAKIYRDLEEFDKEIPVWQKALEYIKDNSKIHYNLGNAYRKLNMDEEAITEYLKAAKLAPNNEKIRYQLGTLYFKNNEFDKSKDQFKALLSINPDNAEVVSWLGRAYLELHKEKEGRRLLKKGIEMRKKKQSRFNR